MKRSLSIQNANQNANRFQTPDRQGSTLIIVLALLGLLTMLGFVFFSFATMERENAENFSEALKEAPDTPDDGFEYGLKNILVGPRQEKYNSSMHGGHHSIVRNLAGTDARPLTGEGRTIAAITGAIPEVPGQPLAGLALAVGARGGNPINTRVNPLANADVGYDYPDHNNVFVGYVGSTVRVTGGVPELIPIIIPSYVRPALMPDGTGTRPLHPNWHGGTGGPVPGSQYTFRPHPAQLYINRNGRPIPVGAAFVRRFLDANNPADAAIITALPGASGAFPFAPTENVDGNNTIQGEMGIWTWPTAALAPGGGAVSPLLIYELDVDNDGDGTPDSIWQDFDYSVLEDPNNGAKYTLMHSVLAIDLDSLVNLNTSGNLAGLEKNSATFRAAGVPLGGVYPPATIPATLVGRTRSIAESNLGLTPSEINPTWAMLRPFPTTGFDWTKDHTPIFNRAPADIYEAANMELFWLMVGRGEYASGGGGLEDLHNGRWGEPDRLLHALNNLGSANPLLNFPRPGLFDTDDDGNVVEGAYGFGLRSYGQPLDFDGSGRFTPLNDPRVAQYLGSRDTALNPQGPIRWLQYTGYSLFDQNGSGTAASAHLNLLPNPYVFGRDDGGSRLNHPNALMQYDAVNGVTTARVNTLFDHESETIVEPERALRPYDDIFDAKDVLELFLDPADATAAIDTVSNRLTTLLPYTFGDTGDISIRKRFTTLSWRYRLLSLASALGPDGLLGTADDGPRAWEHNADTSLFDTNNDGINDPNGKFEFPPQFGTGAGVVRPFVYGFRSLNADLNLNEDPFRPQIRRLLRTEFGDQKAEFGQLPLNINQLTDVERLPNRAADLLRGVLETRPLTEHPLISDPLTQSEVGTNLASWTVKTSDTNLPPFPPTTVQGREFWARRDRQKMARDIYVLLYTLCGGQDAVPATGSTLTVNVDSASYTLSSSVGPAVYTPEQLQQMAQFAVNLVDALDRDDVITKFEYDRNLGTTVLTDATPGNIATYSGWNLDDNPDTTNDVVLPTTLTAGTYPNGDPRETQTVDPSHYERGVVYGVERQQLAFSEAIGILSREITGGGNHPATPWDDADGNGHRIHLLFELQNMLPKTVDLFTGDSSIVPLNGNAAVWRVRRVEPTGAVTPAPDRTLEFLPYSGNSISAGSLFSIGTNYQGDGVSNHYALGFSDYYVDADMDGNQFECIAPPSNVNLPLVANVPPTPSSDTAYNPRTHLDLSHDRHRVDVTRFTVDRAVNPAAHEFLNTIDTASLSPGTSIPLRFDLVLERRANLNMPNLPAGNQSITTDTEPAEGLNDWVEVDRINVRFKTFNIQDSDTVTEIQEHLLGGGSDEGIPSYYRSEILRRSSEARTPAGTPPDSANYPYSLNSIRALAGAPTSGWHPDPAGGPAQQRLQQVHFDRDFASIGELLDIPLFGPDSLTTLLNESRQTAPDQIAAAEAAPLGSIIPDVWTGGTGTSIPAKTRLADRPISYGLVSGALGKLLAPVPPAGSVTQTNNVANNLDNRWYRLLGFVEVPTRMHRQLGNAIGLERIPGAINLNMLRHPEVLAALIDDPQLADLQGAAGPMPGGLSEVTPGSIAGQRDDWFWRLVQSRDGSFTAASGAVVHLPGWGGSNPIQSLTRIDPTGAATKTADLEDTILRSIPVDGAADPRRLFEIGTVADHTANNFAAVAGTGTTTPQLSNPQQRHRLLSKLLNNTTTSSNAFVVFMTIGHFEVHEEANGAVRIGGEYDINGDGMVDQNDRKRAVFVIDRSEAFEAYDPGTGTFDWRRLVKHRVDIQ